MRFWNRYDRLFLRRAAPVALLIGAIIAVPMIIVSCFYDVLPHDLLGSVLFFIAFEAILGVIWLLSLRFREHALLKAQAEQGLKLPEAPLPMLHHDPVLFADADWLVIAGKLIVHRTYLDNVRVKVSKAQLGNTYYCVFDCQDGCSYPIQVHDSSSAKAIREWYRSGIA